MKLEGTSKMILTIKGEDNNTAKKIRTWKCQNRRKEQRKNVDRDREKDSRKNWKRNWKLRKMATCWIQPHKNRPIEEMSRKMLPIINMQVKWLREMPKRQQISGLFPKINLNIQSNWMMRQNHLVDRIKTSNVMIIRETKRILKGRKPKKLKQITKRVYLWS